jgi:hypothetical protein
MQTRAVFLTLTIALVISARLAMAEPATKYVNVSFSLGSPITLHEPVGIDVIIANQVSYAISFDLGLQNKAAYHYSVVTPDRKQIYFPAPIQRGGYGPPEYLRPSIVYPKNWTGN